MFASSACGLCLYLVVHSYIPVFLSEKQDAVILVFDYFIYFSHLCRRADMPQADFLETLSPNTLHLYFSPLFLLRSSNISLTYLSLLLTDKNNITTTFYPPP